MSTALVIAVVIVALACPLHMLWSLARRGRVSCFMMGDDCGDSLPARQRRLAQRVEAAAVAGAEKRPVREPVEVSR